MDIIIQKIKKQISENPILLYMKGSPKMPNCGFSAQATKILSRCIKSFSYVDVLEHTDIRSVLPRLSNWPTYPQLWIDSELIGGCDIMIEMYRNQELQQLIQKIKLKYNLQNDDISDVRNACIT